MSKLLFRDFAPAQILSPALFRRAEYETMSEALQQANGWIDEFQIDVVNVETVVLPNIHSPHEDGSKDPSLHTAGEYGSSWHQVIRVWFKK